MIRRIETRIIRNHREERTMIRRIETRIIRNNQTMVSELG